MAFEVRVINLDRSPERMQTFRVSNPDLPIRRFSAIDGRNYKRDFWLGTGLIAPDNTYNDRAIAVSASHVSLWHEAATAAAPTHIAEDDAFFHPQFVALAQEFLAGLGEWDIVYWGWNFNWPLEAEIEPAMGTTVLLCKQASVRSLLDTFRESRPVLRAARLLSCAGSGAYSLSPHGAKRLLQLSTPLGNGLARDVLVPGQGWLNTGIDVEMARVMPQLKAYVAVPPLVMLPNDQTL